MVRARSRFAAVSLALLLLASLPGIAAAMAARSQTSVPVAAAAGSAQTITRFATSEPVIALTFDAGADRGFASQILDTLAQQGVQATFGMTGVWAADNPDLIQRMVRDGHQLINHTWSHPSFTGASTGTGPLSSAERISQLQRTENLIRQQVGVDLRPYFRPPYGDYDASVLSDVAAAGYLYNIMWTVDTLGWNGLNAAQIRQRVLNAAAPGAIVLMHVGADSQDATALPGMIGDLRARGYRFARVSDFVQGNISPEERYFPQTGHWVSHGFLRYWDGAPGAAGSGGLPVFGYPLTDEFTDPATGHVTQVFERARFEWQPGAWPARYDVLLGRLGAELTAGRQAEPPFRPLQAGNDANCSFSPETGHRLCFGFRDEWQQHGGLAIFGYPISEEFVENGVVVQYFERQRFEYHPENPPAWRVEGGLLGQQWLATRR